MDEHLLIPYTIFYLLLDKIELNEPLLVPNEYFEALNDYEKSGFIDITKGNKNNILEINSPLEKKKDIEDVMLMIISEIPSNKRLHYGEISQVIFTLGTINGNKFNESNDNKISLNIFNEDDLKKCDKINDHITLSIIQLNQIIKVSEEAKEISNQAKEISNQTLKDVDNIKEIKGQIYSEFIAILGVFSALIFGLFGGFEGIKGVLSLFEKGDNFGVVSMYCGLITLMIVTITFALVQFVGRLIGKNLKSCCCTDDCNCRPRDKYKIYTICVYISIGMILLGAALTERSMLIKIIFSIIIIGIVLVILGDFPKNFIECFKKIKKKE